jgi:hypothetical protein
MTDLIIFTCEGREHLLQKSYESFSKACDYPFRKTILAIDGRISPKVIDTIQPDIIVQSYNRKGYVHNIISALKQVDAPYFFWLEDDWKFNSSIDIPFLMGTLKKNKDWAEIVFSQAGPLKPEAKLHPFGNNMYQTIFGFSANPCICNSAHLKSTFTLLAESPKGGKLGEDGFENFLSRAFEKENIKCVILDPVDHLPISHEGYLESTPRNWHMTNSLESKTKAHLLTIPPPSIFRKLLMVLKLIKAFVNLSIGQLFNNKVYELCFRIITSAKTVKKDE